ncbi:alpha/beta fold hydrolase [Xanthomonas translucens]|uniref:alpha/beta fold hydrolase n=1 Tax=Xanthomonas campestris pv. translucens TaxID=343 RepID=UPI0002A7988B|nr:alpha/beta hydrolase [Xanthomonas translucens]AVY65384.1 alpha/beta hydrolase [Xanthomonas translucens pv. undulosa]ELQ16416.1 alpha/beta hydrolase [Xanthomonas translucens DAR61454]MBC3972489.1 alpha/beta hydrolase [Xanthomonas translucens pv. undulosa]MCT8283385.1 alpha/beta hydrolase [Xanthomonas translucens pv. undulosa]MCT8318202.1 alpha/beta hydrolase [Xanthomonas translucens pv. undulosa]
MLLLTVVLLLAFTALAVGVTLLVGAVLLLRSKPFLLVRLESLRQRWGSGLRRCQTQVAGHRWTYLHRAAADPAAPALLLVHGFTGSKENWLPLARALGDRYHLFLPDLPGWAESQRIDGQDYGFVAQAERVAAFAAQCVRGTGSECVLIGHSMGGGIAALAAARHPPLFDRVGLLNAAGVRFADNAFGQAVLDGDNPFAVYDADSLRRYIDTVFVLEPSKPRIPSWAVSSIVAWRRSEAGFEQQVLARIGRSEEAFLPFEEAARIRQPALLLNCVQDAVIDASALALYAERVPQALQVLLDGSGHMSIVEKPAEVAQAIDQLIQRGVPR